jgi:hypothetical protein
MKAVQTAKDAQENGNKTPADLYQEAKEKAEAAKEAQKQRDADLKVQ